MHKNRTRSRGGIIVLVVVLVLFMGVILNITRLAEIVIRHVLASRPGISVEAVHIGRLRASFPGHLRFDHVKLGLQVNAKPLVIEAPEVRVDGLQTFFSRGRQVVMVAEHVYASYDKGVADALSVRGVLTSEGISAPVTAKMVRWDKFHVEDVSADVILDAAGVRVRQAVAKAYGGRISAGAVVRQQQNDYAFELSLQDIDMAKLGEIDPGIPEQLNGRVTGSVKFTGDMKTVRSLDTDLFMPAGGMVSASLLSALTQYLPQSQEKKRLDLLIRSGGKLGMEMLAFTMKGGQDGKFSGEVRLRSREVNLELNLTHEINTDGTLASLFAYWQRFLN